ncbi:hypothetical protein [Alloactinosynnema sp. L-07]|uniref:hypothetical protein n=1 Tax=Alloactinosynnema sp. L-07 TaxID=1653480 RepID=UPI0012FA5237|nr:hypothetical protein [Alloactinosynnema sp. L-07]
MLLDWLTAHELTLTTAGQGNLYLWEGAVAQRLGVSIIVVHRRAFDMDLPLRSQAQRDRCDRREVIRLWDETLTKTEIGRRLGMSPGHLARI